MAWKEKCKIDFNKQVEIRRKKGEKIKDIISQLSKESGIPKETLRNWLYPKRVEKHQEKRKSKLVSVNPTINRIMIENKIIMEKAIRIGFSVMKLESSDELIEQINKTTNKFNLLGWKVK